MKRKEGYPSLEADKILDPLPDLEIESLRHRERLGRVRSERAVHTKGSRSWRPFLLVLMFLLGVGIGWLLHSTFSRTLQEFEKEGQVISEWFGYPFTGVRFEKSSKKEGTAQNPKAVILHRGETIHLKYGSESLRYLSLERRSSPWGALMAMFVSAPTLYIEQRPLDPGVDLGRLLEPEKALSYNLELKAPDKANPVAAFQLKVNMDAQGWLSRAGVLHDLQTRRRCLEKAAEDQPGNADILMALGKLLWEQKETKGAIERFQQVLKDQPKHIEARKALATIYWKKEPKRALEIYRDLAKLDDNDRVDHYKQVARLEERLGLNPAETYRKILSIRKNDPDAVEGIEGLYAERVKRAQEWEKKGQLEKAIREMKRALEVQSTEEARNYLATLYNNLGYYLVKKEKLKGAIRVYERSLRWNKDPVTYLNLADAYKRTNQIAKGLAALEKAHGLKPKDPKVAKSILLLWGEFLMAEEKYSEAIEKYKELRGRFTKDREIVKSLGMAYWKKGDHANALETLKQLTPLLASRPAKERAEIHRLIGDLHRIIGDRVKDPKARIVHYDRALRAYEQAISLNGRDKKAQTSWEEVAEERKSLKIQMLQSS